MGINSGFKWLNRLGGEVGDSTSSSAETKKEWSHNLAPLQAFLQKEEVNLPYFAYDANGRLKLWVRLVEYLVIKLCCFSCACCVLSIAMMDVNCEFVLILKEAAMPF
jgi:hypothetical protein